MTTVLVDDIWPWVRFVGQNLMKNSLCFFRGQSNAQWVIKSTFERECCTSDKSDLAHGVTFAEMRLRAQERRLLTQFVRDGWKYTSGNFNGNLTMVEWYSLMRHYGIPTRMVDFTESALIALYFALSDCNANHNFAVWSVNSKMLGNVEIQKEINKEISNQYGLDAMRKLNRAGGGKAKRKVLRERTGIYYNAISAISANEEFAECVLGDAIDNQQLKDIGLDIIYFYPKHRNARMGAQSGLFLMPTRLSKSFMESLQSQCDSVEYDNAAKEIVLTDENVDSLRVDPIVKFEFNANLKDEGRRLLQMANITPRTVYPDIEGIAKELQGKY